MMAGAGLLSIVIIGGAIYLAFVVARRAGWGGAGGALRDGSAEEIVRQRYARGEIDRDAYDSLLRDLRR